MDDIVIQVDKTPDAPAPSPARQNRAKVTAVIAGAAFPELVLIAIAVGLPAVVTLSPFLGALIVYGAPVLGLVIVVCAIIAVASLSRESPRDGELINLKPSSSVITGQSLQRVVDEDLEESWWMKCPRKIPEGPQETPKKADAVPCPKWWNIVHSPRLVILLGDLDNPSRSATAVSQWTLPQRVALIEEVIKCLQIQLMGLTSDDIISDSHPHNAWSKVASLLPLARALSALFAPEAITKWEACKTSIGSAARFLRRESFFIWEDYPAALSCIECAQARFAGVKEELLAKARQLKH